MTELKVSKTTSPQGIAGSISKFLEIEETISVRAIGPFATNQLIKGIAIARGFLAPQGEDLICVPSFVDVNINGEHKSAIKIVIKKIKNKGE